MKVVITGGSGFMGRALLQRLASAQLHAHAVSRHSVAQDLEVHVLGSSKASIQQLTHDHPGLQVAGPWPQGGPSLDKSLSGADVLLHMAWSTMPSTAAADPARDMRENVEGGARFLDRAAQAGVRCVVFLSSGGTVYGEARQLPMTEDHPLVPITQYGASKLAFEQLLVEHARQHSYRPVILRPGNVYGNTRVVGRPQGVVEHWLMRSAAGEPLEVWNELSLVRDYVYIDDMVDVLVAVMRSEQITGAFNVGTGVGTSLQQLVEYIEQVTGRPTKVEPREAPIRAVMANVLDPNKLLQALGIAPTTPLQQGLKRLWEQLGK